MAMPCPVAGGGSMTTDRVSDTNKNAEEKVSRRNTRFLRRLQCAVRCARRLLLLSLEAHTEVANSSAHWGCLQASARSGRSRRANGLMKSARGDAPTCARVADRIGDARVADGRALLRTQRN